MPLTRVTITGADDAVDPVELLELSDEFPFVEWGILHSLTRQGEARYPTAKWRARAERVLRDRAQLSAHLCGQMVRDTLGGSEQWVKSVPAEYGRVQLNGWSPTPAALEIVGRFGVEWILQCRSEEALREAARCAGLNVSALFDPSGGRGIAPDSWPAAPPGLRVGYAGSIGPDNIVAVIEAIGQVEHDFWLDMETGARTNDEFDADKALAVLRRAAPHIKQETST